MPYYNYVGPKIVPENDPEFLLHFFAIHVLPPSIETDVLTNIEIHKVYPDLRVQSPLVVEE